MMEAVTDLESWPEVIKAVTMATAQHNIEGASRLSEEDGAGGFYPLHAVQLVRSGTNGNWSGEQISCSSAFPINKTFSVVGGRVTRVVIVWDQDPDYASYVDKPSADLDLQIRDASDNLVTTSNSWDNTYEIAQFTPPSSGTYTARVINFRCDSRPEALGFAWYQIP
jgi:hypothetical protein